MSELRQNMATKEWVVIASERAKRPDQFIEKIRPVREVPAHSESCPFCPGNETQTPPQSYAIMRDKRWQVRAFPNKFGAASMAEPPARSVHGVHRSMSGHGMHEVIVETPVHNLCMASMPERDIIDVLEVYRHLYLVASEDPTLSHVVIFKNHGPEAGTSLEHPHSQLVALPVVPAGIRTRMESAMHYYDDHGACAFCRMLADEVSDGKRLVVQGEHFAAFVLFAALTPFHIWMLPKRHSSSFGETTDDELRDMGSTLRRLLAKVHKGLRNPDFNFAIRCAPLESPTLNYMHWYLSLTVRLTKAAGFELGSGMFINTSIPEQSAAFLNQVEIDS